MKKEQREAGQGGASVDVVIVKSMYSPSNAGIPSDEWNSKPDGAKRQRTISASPSPTREPNQFTLQADSDDGTNIRNSGGKKIRGAAAKNHKEKSEREERERLRLEAKRKREGRAERRRVDGRILYEHRF